MRVRFLARSGRLSTGVTSGNPCPTLDVYSCVLIPVEHHFALGAYVRSNLKGLGHQRIAPGASRRGVVWRDQRKRLTSFLGFVSHHRDEHRPTRIGYGLRQPMIFEHVPNAQLLESETIMGVHQATAGLVQEISSPINDSFVCPGHLGALLAAVVGASLLARKPPLLPPKLLLGALERSCRLRHCPIGRCEVVLQAQVESGQWPILNRDIWDFTGDAQPPLPRRMAHDGSRLRCSLMRAMIPDGDIPDAGKSDPFAAREDAKRCRLRVGKGAVAPLHLEARVSTTRKESFEGTIKAKNSVLQHLGVYLRVARESLLEVGQGAILLVGRDGTLFGLVSVSSLGQREVVEEPQRFQPPAKLRFLCRRGVESVAVGENGHTTIIRQGPRFSSRRSRREAMISSRRKGRRPLHTLG